MNTFEFIILAVFLLFIFSCSHPERFGCNLSSDGSYVCLDGSKGRFTNGTDGSQGPKGDIGSVGPSGPAGTNGQNAEPCSVVDNADGAVITCPDGSSVEIFDGQDGEDGQVIIVCHKNTHAEKTCVKHSKDK